MTFEEYAKIDAINFTTLKETRKSPKHFKYRRENPREDTTRLGLGRAAHTAVFEPDRFPLDYAVFRGARRAGKAWDEFQDANEGRTILKADEYAACLAMRDAVRACPAAAKWLKAGKPEHTITWTDKETGLPCKARIDWLSIGSELDLKTTATVDPRWFGSAAARLGWHIQQAFYLDGLAAHGLVPEARIIAVEAEPPHDCAVFLLNEDVLYAAREEMRELLRRVAGCMERNEWPGRFDEVGGETMLELPGWCFPEDGEGGFSVTTVAEEV